MSDVVAGTGTCIRPDRYPALFSTSNFLQFADSPYANPAALAFWRQTAVAPLSLQLDANGMRIRLSGIFTSCTTASLQLTVPNFR